MSSAHRVLPFSTASSALAKPKQGQPAEASELLLGPSDAVSHLWSQIRRVAPYFRTALLTGENGTGCHAVARALHDLSPGCRERFISLTPPDAEDCFSQGRFEPSRHEGTFFLANAEQLSRTAQSGVLRLLHRRGQQAVRIIAFAQHGLRPATSTGTFSSELAGSLAAVRIALPALRERSDDIPLLISHLLHNRTEALNLLKPALSADFLDAATRYAWPGNLDQMASVLDWLLEWAQGDTFEATALAAAISARASVSQPAATRMIKLNQIVQEHIRAVLLACNGNKLRAADILGISRSTLYRMLEETGHRATFADAG